MDNCPLNFTERNLYNQLKQYKILPNVIKYYKNKTKNNKNEEYRIIRAKIIRNIVLGRKGEIINNREISYYGNLMIIYNYKERAIVYIKNCEGKFEFSINQEKKKWLEKDLGLIQEVETNENNLTYNKKIKLIELIRNKIKLIKDKIELIRNRINTYIAQI